jgi:hypothetical protein
MGENFPHARLMRWKECWKKHVAKMKSTGLEKEHALALSVVNVGFLDQSDRQLSTS